MNFTELNIKPFYESGTENLVEGFYEPVLSAAVKYDRISGFFSSSSLAIAARGMAEFIKHGGKMRLISCPMLSPNDVSIIQKLYSNSDGLVCEDLNLNIDSLQTEFEVNHVKALGWMLKEGLLEMKLAIIKNEDGSICTSDTLFSNGIFHQKVGILEDSAKNILSFSGSINESASAWTNNDEEFKVFSSWTPLSVFTDSEIKKFSQFWNGERKNVDIFDLPTAVKQSLISYSKDFDVESISLRKYRQLKEKQMDVFPSEISLFPYQKEALKKWRDSNFQMLFEMATGTGKTRTAIAGMNHIKNSQDKVFVVVACPQGTLSLQWKGEIDKLGIIFDVSEIIDGTNKHWRNSLREMLNKCKAGFVSKCIIYTTHRTSSSDDFVAIVKNSKIANKVPIVFVADEVHWLGATKSRAALLNEYKYRIGLSATPSRWFDDYGTKIIDDYFNNTHFEFTIKQALENINPLTGKHFLVNYNYIIKKLSLNETEALEYKTITAKLVTMYNSKDSDSESSDIYERLLEKRANIVKNAESKYQMLSSLLDELKQNNQLEDLIVFVSPQQMDRVLEIFASKNVFYHKLTEGEDAKKSAKYGGLSEREFIIEKFKDKTYKALIAIKCLDEGIDIPSAQRGILMSNSTNPREYVQRIGRIIRQDFGKSIADLYDFVVGSVDVGDFQDVENKIREKERKRMTEIAENAINVIDATKEILTL